MQAPERASRHEEHRLVEGARLGVRLVREQLLIETVARHTSIQPHLQPTRPLFKQVGEALGLWQAPAENNGVAVQGNPASARPGIRVRSIPKARLVDDVLGSEGPGAS